MSDAYQLRKKARDNQRAYEHTLKRHERDGAHLRQQALTNWAKRHNITCFKCGAAKAQWAKNGTSTIHGPWIICTTCTTTKAA